MAQITIMVANSFKLFRESVSEFINADERFLVIAQPANESELFEHYKQLMPDIVLMDATTDGLNCTGITNQLFGINKDAKIICVTYTSDAMYSQELLDNGIKGVVSRQGSNNELISAIYEVYSGKRYICSKIRDNYINSFLEKDNLNEKYQSLTNREKEVVALVNKGYSSKEIAEFLKVSFKTIEAHRYNSCKKLKVNKVTSLAHYSNFKYSF